MARLMTRLTVVSPIQKSLRVGFTLVSLSINVRSKSLQVSLTPISMVVRPR